MSSKYLVSAPDTSGSQEIKQCYSCKEIPVFYHIFIDYYETNGNPNIHPIKDICLAKRKWEASLRNKRNYFLCETCGGTIQEVLNL